MEQLSSPAQEKELSAPNEKLLRKPTFWERILEQQGKTAKWLAICSVFIFILLLISIVIFWLLKTTQLK